ncbi:MAG TPA: hypothetical protein VEA59_00715 [Patescibacteria group bacterium]|nr:hypothetical protein [Patescibacteria group bacterium]
MSFVEEDDIAEHLRIQSETVKKRAREAAGTELKYQKASVRVQKKHHKLLPDEVALLARRANWLHAVDNKHCMICGITMHKPPLDEFSVKFWQHLSKCQKHKEQVPKIDARFCTRCGKRYTLQSYLDAFPIEETAVKSMAHSELCLPCKPLAAAENQARTQAIVVQIRSWKQTLEQA